MSQSLHIFYAIIQQQQTNHTNCRFGLLLLNYGIKDMQQTNHTNCRFGPLHTPLTP